MRVEPQPIVILGAGGFGREVLDILKAQNGIQPVWSFLGFLDDGHPDLDRLQALSAPYLGPTSELSALPDGCGYSIGVGDPIGRRSLDEEAEIAGLSPAQVIHPSATIGANVTLGPGAVICSHVSVTTNVTLGRQVHVNLNSTIGHDAELGNFVTVMPGVNISGDVRLRDGVTMGTHSAILQGLTVGQGAFIGAGAVVTKDIKPGVIATGIPARPR